MYQVSEVMDGAASLLNDTARAVFTYTVQIPFLNQALQELDDFLELNQIPASKAVDESIVILSGVRGIGASGQPVLPIGFVAPTSFYERLNGSTEDYTFMQQCDFLPTLTTQTSYLQWWSYQEQQVKFIGANTDRQLRIEYVKRRLPRITASTDVIDLENSQLFLMNRVAALCADFIGENEMRAQKLNTTAALALDRTLGISIKGEQSIGVRRRPFMSSYRAGYGDW